MHYHERTYAFRGPGLGAAVKYLLIVNGALFFLKLVTGWRLIGWLGLTPTLIWHKGYLWQLVTYMFLHGGFWHLAINMFVLWMFGTELERTWGTKQFLKYYFVTGIGAGLLSLIATPNSAIPTVGASGAIFGLLVAYAMIYPNRLIYLWFFIPIKAKYLALILGVFELIATLQLAKDGVAHWAHLGGMLVGFIYLKMATLARGGFATFEKRRIRVVSPDDSASEDLQQEVDRILRKISQLGIDSLTPEEKRTLERASRTFRNP
ncbi:MAG: rhomboid family intramembrane serine protease [bacterium]